MTNPLKGEAALGDKTLSFDFGTFIILEVKAGKKIPLLLDALQEGLGFGELRDFVWAGLQERYQMPEDEVVLLLNEVGYETAANAVGKAIAAHFGAQRAKGKNPRKAK